MNQTTISDVQLLAQLQTGQEASFETLFTRHYQRVYEVLFRLLGDEAEAEDVAQQVFLKFYQAPERLEAANETTNLVGWLYRVATNEGYNALRSRKRRLGWHERFARLWPFSRTAADPADTVEQQDQQSRVRQILIDMKPQEAKLLLLRHSGLSYRELAKALDVPPGSIGSMLTRAERKFAQKYGQVFGQEGQ